MNDPSDLETVPTRRRTSISSICLIMVLYLLQGMNLGIAGSMTLFLVAHGVTWKDIGTYNFAFYPFSLKLIWAPLIDVLYSNRFGRRKSWLVPIQLTMAGILLLLSFYVGTFIATGRVILLMIIFFMIVFLTASQDICVDGLAITLFTATNPQWASTSQAVGQTLGRFLGSSFLLTFESANFTNKFIREPLSLPPQESGLFSLENFIRFAALAFLTVTICLIVFVREKKEPIINGEESIRLSLFKTYVSVINLFKKKCIRDLTLVSMLAPIGMVATNYMTNVTLINQGVPRSSLALVHIPVTLVGVISPLIIRHTEKPLTWFARSYMAYLISEIPIAVYVYFTPHMISSWYYYPALILILALNECIMTLRFSAQVGFFASISEPRIGGTYMTLLVTLHNLGFALNSSIILYAASWLPKEYAYVIAVGLCFILGIIWLGFSSRTLKRLQELPTYIWHLIPETNTNDATTPDEQDKNDHEVSLISDKEKDPSYLNS